MRWPKSTYQVMQLKLEGEVAFVLKKDLTGPNVTTAVVLEATEYVLAAIEIVDNRVQDWEIKPHDTIADNAYWKEKLYVKQQCEYLE